MTRKTTKLDGMRASISHCKFVGIERAAVEEQCRAVVALAKALEETAKAVSAVSVNIGAIHLHGAMVQINDPRDSE